MRDDLKQIDENLYEIPKEARSDMRVPARIYADQELLELITSDRSLEQLQNVATLPGIVECALAMPDIHQGYGFPVGGIAATETPDGVISPGGVGYDINCGVRLLACDLAADELGKRLEPLVHELSRAAPPGPGKKGVIHLSIDQLNGVLSRGSRALVEEHGIGNAEDVVHTESEGCLDSADPDKVSARAKQRGHKQLGTIGSGNHFIELQRVMKVIDAEAADAFGLHEGQLTILIHSGSRGLGHQVCTDYVKLMDSRVTSYNFELPDRELACAPLSTEEGHDYLGAMAAAANFAWANRHAIAHAVRRSLESILGKQAAAGTRQVYDVCHNVAKIEEHRGRELCVHRKGATRAFGPSSPEIPTDYQGVGQPVFIPGSMGTSSFVLAGNDRSMEVSFGTTCHGAGRLMSRTKARKQIQGNELRRQLADQGIVIRCPSNRGLAEEAPFAYKDVESVVNIVDRAEIARKVAQLKPIGVVKG